MKNKFTPEFSLAKEYAETLKQILHEEKYKNY